MHNNYGVFLIVKNDTHRLHGLNAPAITSSFILCTVRVHCENFQVGMSDACIKVIEIIP